jgi:leucyl-tRNA synthetase
MAFLKRIEKKWQQKWEEARIFEADPDPKKPKYYITVAYPYPNSPQHIGHGRTYTLADVHARYMRMRGYNVLLPMAFHYTGTPVLAMAKRLAAKDKDLINDFVNVYKVPEEKLRELTEPFRMAKYFHQEIKTGMKAMGYSIDWRREFTTIDPQYNRFIEWQFQKLRQKGYITRGSHPVGWCPKDGNPVGQHDTRGDIEPEIGEFVLIKFRCGDWTLPAATLRPETIFGVTNMWLNPNAQYVKAKVDNEKWIISQESAEKLRYLNRKVTIIESFEGRELVGKTVENPATKKKIPILPADFVDPKNATGVVMSVPGHAPYDFVALENLKETPSQLKQYGLGPDILNEVAPISIIAVSEYSGIPAGDVVKKMGIDRQTDPRLEDATKEVYRHEFHNGKMKPNTGKYMDMSVAEAKERVKQDLTAESKAETMYELLNKPVFCRCGTECVVKIFEDQWFIDYSNQNWKQLAHKALDEMEILPEELRPEFNYVIDWLHEKACARKSGMGTKLPWDREWIIESLSDSTIYMAYYTIVKHLKKHCVTANQLTEQVCDYIFLGKGKPAEVAKEAGIKTDTLEEMRKEFTYFYPLDSRHSGRDLVANHLTFMIFNHAAVFPIKLWPRQIATNGFVMMEGAKMSKSFGNISPLIEAAQAFGADPVRLGILSTAELLADADFSPTLARSMRERLERIYRLVEGTIETQPSKITTKPRTQPDKWILSRLQDHINTATDGMNKLTVRKAIHSSLYELEQDLQWYARRTADQRDNKQRRTVINQVMRQILDAQIRMLAPVTPHVCEEMWEKMNGKGFVSLTPWPVPSDNLIDINAEEREDLIKDTLEDTLDIIRTTNITPKKIHYYTAASWKWKAYMLALRKSTSAKLVQGELMKELMSKNEMKALAKPMAKFIGQIIDEVNHMSPETKKRHLKARTIYEQQTLEEAKDFFKRELNANIVVCSEDDPKRHDPKNRAQLAKPYRPAIYIE